MSDISEVLTLGEMIEANQRNELNFFIMTSKSSKDIFHLDENGFEGVYSAMPIPILNRVMRANATTKDLKENLNHLKKKYHENNISMHWELWPSNFPGNTKEILQEYGFEYDRDFPAMVLEAKQIPEEQLFSLRIKKVQNEKEAGILADLFAEIYGVPESARDDYLNNMLNAGFDLDSKLHNYIGYEEDKPVSISSTFYDSGVVGIYNVGTIEGYNRKGYGTEITLYPLLEAKERGYKYMMLQSSDQGVKVYQRMGFKELCKVETYKLEP